jgi:riboflavin synthase
MRVQIPESYQSLIVEKGSIAIDGISLTINSIPNESEIEIMLIPHTLKATNAIHWRSGSRVHLEFDLIAKQIARMVELYTGQRSEMQPLPAGTIIGAFE